MLKSHGREPGCKCFSTHVCSFSLCHLTQRVQLVFLYIIVIMAWMKVNLKPEKTKVIIGLGKETRGYGANYIGPSEWMANKTSSLFEGLITLPAAIIWAYNSSDWDHLGLVGRWILFSWMYILLLLPLQNETTALHCVGLYLKQLKLRLCLYYRFLLA